MSHPSPSHAAHDAHGSHGDAGHHHVASAGLFFNVLVALLFLTVITVAASRFDFGSANLLIAMLFASVKAALVMSIFMHLKWDTAVNRIMFLSSFLFLSLLFLFTLADLSTRGMDEQLQRVSAPVADQWKHPNPSGGGAHH